MRYSIIWPRSTARNLQNSDLNHGSLAPGSLLLTIMLYSFSNWHGESAFTCEQVLILSPVMDSHPFITKSSGLEQNLHLGRDWPWQNFRKRKELNTWCKWTAYSQEKGWETWATYVHFIFPKLPIQLTFSSSMEKRVKIWREERVLHHRYYLDLEENISNEEVFSALPPPTTFSSLFALLNWTESMLKHSHGEEIDDATGQICFYLVKGTNHCI